MCCKTTTSSLSAESFLNPHTKHQEGINIETRVWLLWITKWNTFNSWSCLIFKDKRFCELCEQCTDEQDVMSWKLIGSQLWSKKSLQHWKNQWRKLQIWHYYSPQENIPKQSLLRITPHIFCRLSVHSIFTCCFFLACRDIYQTKQNGWMNETKKVCDAVSTKTLQLEKTQQQFLFYKYSIFTVLCEKNGACRGNSDWGLSVMM